MIACYELTVTTPGSEGRLFDGASFEIEEGEWGEIVGPAGTGKSLLCHLVALEYRPVEGRLVVAGRNLGRADSTELVELRRQIGCVRQQPEFLEDRSVLENVVAPLVIRGDTSGAREKATRSLDRAGLTDRAEVSARDLSVGERRLLAVLRATIGAPKIVVSDGALEALSGREYEAAERVLTRAYESGRTILVFGRRPSSVEGVDGPTFEISGGAIRRMDS